MLSKLLAGIVMGRIDYFGYAKISGVLAGGCQDISTFMLANQALTALHSPVLRIYELYYLKVFHPLLLANKIFLDITACKNVDIIMHLNKYNDYLLSQIMLVVYFSA